MARPRSGYARLLRLTVDDIVAVHDEVARVGETWDLGIREVGSIHLLVDRVRDAAREGLPPEEIAALAMHFLVTAHPFWDANHRTGFEAAQLVLRAFGHKIEAPKREIEDRVRAIDSEGLGLDETVRWVGRRARPLR